MKRRHATTAGIAAVLALAAFAAQAHPGGGMGSGMGPGMMQQRMAAMHGGPARAAEGGKGPHAQQGERTQGHQHGPRAGAEGGCPMAAAEGPHAGHRR